MYIFRLLRDLASLRRVGLVEHRAREEGVRAHDLAGTLRVGGDDVVGIGALDFVAERPSILSRAGSRSARPPRAACPCRGHRPSPPDSRASSTGASFRAALTGNEVGMGHAGPRMKRLGAISEIVLNGLHAHRVAGVDVGDARREGHPLGLRHQPIREKGCGRRPRGSRARCSPSPRRASRILPLPERSGDPASPDADLSQLHLFPLLRLRLREMPTRVLAQRRPNLAWLQCDPAPTAIHSNPFSGASNDPNSVAGNSPAASFSR